MVSKCINCSKEFEHGTSGNMIVFCPHCNKLIESVSDYGFGPVVPCDIYSGDRIIASISAANELVSEEFGLRITLCGKYENLEIYSEAGKIIEELLK